MASKVKVTDHKMLTINGRDVAVRLYCEKDKKQKIYDVTIKALKDEGIGAYTVGSTQEIRQYEDNGLFMTKEEFEGKEKSEDASHNKLKVKMLVKLLLENKLAYKLSES